jgi:hypothetical protein
VDCTADSVYGPVWFQERRGISWLAERLSASEGWFNSKRSGNYSQALQDLVLCSPGRHCDVASLNTDCSEPHVYCACQYKQTDIWFCFATVVSRIISPPLQYEGRNQRNVCGNGPSLNFVETLAPCCVVQ